MLKALQASWLGLALFICSPAWAETPNQDRGRISFENSYWTLHSVDEGDRASENYFVNRVWLHLHPHLQVSLNTTIGSANLENIYRPDGDKLTAKLKLSTHQIFALGGSVLMQVIDEGHFRLRAFFGYNRTVGEFELDVDEVEVEAKNLQITATLKQGINEFAKQHLTFRQSWTRTTGGLNFSWAWERFTLGLNLGAENYVGQVCGAIDNDGRFTLQLLSPKFDIGKCKIITHTAMVVEPGITYRPNRSFEVSGQLIYIPSSDLIWGGSLGLTIFGF